MAKAKIEVEETPKEAEAAPLSAMPPVNIHYTRERIAAQDVRKKAAAKAVN